MPAKTRRTSFALTAGRIVFGMGVGKLLIKQQLARRDQFSATGAAPGHVVFLGDSITEFGSWAEWFPEVPTLNRGVSGETSAQVRARVNTAVCSPRRVLLLVGTNDLAAGVDQSQIVANVQGIVDEVERLAPGTSVVVQSVMPRSLVFRDEILELNTQYQHLVAAATPQVSYLDLWPALATSQGRLRPELTRDGLHLNGEGYRVWADVLRPVVQETWRPAESSGQRSG